MTCYGYGEEKDIMVKVRNIYLCENCIRLLGMTINEWDDEPAIITGWPDPTD